MNLQHSINIKQLYSATKALLPYLDSDKHTFDGALLNSWKLLEKCTDILLEFSESYQFILRQAGVSGSTMLSDNPAFFIFRKF